MEDPCPNCRRGRRVTDVASMLEFTKSDDAFDTLLAEKRIHIKFNLNWASSIPDRSNRQ
tara:strand:- start:3897 stop:4073 length:177 start_codon:yes stop_codon:yes gene_type:complete